MARLPRLSLPGVMHYLLQRGHNGGVIARDVTDTERLLQALREAALEHGVVLHAYAVSEHELRVLATPDSAQGVSRMMQAVGRRYAAQFNRRHHRSGALWDGRFRSALIEPGPSTLAALRQVDALGLLQTSAQADAAAQDAVSAPSQTPSPVAGSASPSVAEPAHTQPVGAGSARHRLGGRRDAALVDPPEYWALGNTPFDRELRYRALVLEPLPGDTAMALTRALKGAWALGSPAFLDRLAAGTDRPLVPRPRGRPRRMA